MTMLQPGLDAREGLVQAGPLSFQPSVKYIQRTFTYAELVALGTTPTQVIGAVAGKWIIPISITAELERTNGTAGTTVPCQLRYNGDALNTSILGNNISPAWANGPGLSLSQRYQAFYFNTSITFQGGSGVPGYTPRGKAINFVQTAGPAATGCVGSVVFTFGYIESR